MENHSTISSDWVKNWQSSIAVKITAAVLYGVVFVGFLTGVVFQQGAEQRLDRELAVKADCFAYKLSLALNAEPLPGPKLLSEAMEGSLHEAGFSAVEIELGHETFT